MGSDHLKEKEKDSYINTKDHVEEMSGLLILRQVDKNLQSYNFQNKPFIFLTLGICYQVLTKKLNWVDSALECKILGGSLANLKTSDENSFVQSESVFPIKLNIITKKR